jgi:hypothetical protein
MPTGMMHNDVREPDEKLLSPDQVKSIIQKRIHSSNQNKIKKFNKYVREAAIYGYDSFTCYYDMPEDLLPGWKKVPFPLAGKQNSVNPKFGYTIQNLDVFSGNKYGAFDINDELQRYPIMQGYDISKKICASQREQGHT